MIATARFSLRNTLAGVAGLALMTTLAACDKKEDGTTSTTSASTPAAAAVGGKKAKATLKLADAQAAYKANFLDMSKMNDPMAKKIDAFLAKVGKPSTDTGRKKTWYALDGDKCSKVELDTKDGSMMDMTTDKADCGM